MKTISLVILALLFATALCAVESNRNEVVWWEEDFESAGNGWTHYAEFTNGWHSVAQNPPPYPEYGWLMGPGY